MIPGTGPIAAGAIASSSPDSIVARCDLRAARARWRILSAVARVRLIVSRRTL